MRGISFLTKDPAFLSQNLSKIILHRHWQINLPFGRAPPACPTLFGCLRSRILDYTLWPFYLVRYLTVYIYLFFCFSFCSLICLFLPSPYALVSLTAFRCWSSQLSSVKLNYLLVPVVNEGLLFLKLNSIGFLRLKYMQVLHSGLRKCRICVPCNYFLRSAPWTH